MKKEMLINVLQPEECRIAIVEDGVLEELYVERTSHESYVGNIYKGRIVNIEPSIQAAFVDFGVGRNGFLHVSDVEPTYYRHLEQGRSDNGGRRGGRDRHRSPTPPVAAPEDPLDLDDERPQGDSEESAARAEPAQRERSGSSRRERGEPSRGRRRGRSGRGRRDQRDRQPPDLGGAEGTPTTEGDAERAHEPPAPEDGGGHQQQEPRERTQFMDSAERRTEEDGATAEPVEPDPNFDDEGLFFPREEPPQAAHPREVAEPAPAAHDESYPEAATALTEDVEDQYGIGESAAEPADERQPDFDDDEAPLQRHEPPADFEEDENFEPAPRRLRPPRLRPAQAAHPGHLQARTGGHRPGHQGGHRHQGPDAQYLHQHRRPLSRPRCRTCGTSARHRRSA